MNWAAYLTTLTGLFMVIAWWQVIRVPLDRLGQELGWALARNQLDRLNRADAIAELQLDMIRWRRELASGGPVRYWRPVRGVQPSPSSRELLLCGLCGRPVHDCPRTSALMSGQPAPLQCGELPWLCPACQHGNHGCEPGRCRCPGARLA